MSTKQLGHNVTKQGFYETNTYSIYTMTKDGDSYLQAIYTIYIYLYSNSLSENQIYLHWNEFIHINPVQVLRVSVISIPGVKGSVNQYTHKAGWCYEGHMGHAHT